MARGLAVGSLLVALVALCGCSRFNLAEPIGALPPRAPADGRLHVALQPSARVGAVSGYLQTPRGGGAGTTSVLRPTLKEIGVTGATEVGVQARLDWRRHGAVIEARRLVLSGDAVLREDLTSQAAFFPAGTSVDSDSYLTMLSGRYTYLFEVPLGPRDRLELRPGIGMRGVGVNYQLDGSNGASTDRSYTTFAPVVGLDWSWRPRDEGRIEFSGYVGQTIETFLHERRRFSVFDASGRMHYLLSPKASLYLETGYRHVLMDDVQPVRQNRIHVDFGPYVGVGADIRF